MWILLIFLVLVIAVYLYTYPRAGIYLQAFDNYIHCRRASLTKHATVVKGKNLVWYDNLQYQQIDDRPVLLLLHGFTADKQVWLKAAVQLSHHFRLVIPDMPGHGDSETPNYDSFSLDALAECFIDLMEQIRVEHYFVAGNSLGGLTAAKMGTMVPDTILGNVLINPAGIANESEPTPFMAMMKNGVNPFFTRSRQQFSTLFTLSMARPPLMPKVVVDALADNHIASSANYESFFACCFNDASIFNDKIETMTVPTLLIFGMKDDIISTATIDFWRQSDAVEFQPFYDAGHMPMMEIPARTSFAIQFFIEKLKS